LRYVSTRGAAPDLGFEDVLLTGLARDGGLYVPERFPSFAEADWRALRGAPYQAVAAAVMRPFIGDALSPADFAALVADSYAGFRHKSVAPLKQIGPNDWLLELFHGPTLAFKDYALQLVGRLFDRVLARGGRHLAILGATSGDTGSAAIEACRGRDSLDVFILYPHGRTSDVQRRQMTTVDAPNIHAIAIEGTFDDCQDIVKALFNDLDFRDRASLGAVNSINWARIMAQIVYYATAALSLGSPDRKVSFTVPTGNFGNIYAAYCAWRMGLPIERLVIGTNRNDILARFLKTGTMTVAEVEPSLSPSMDIQVSSNLERLLFELVGRDGPHLAHEMVEFRRTGSMTLDGNVMDEARRLFDAVSIDDPATLAAIARSWKESGEIIDPHSAVAVAAAKERRGDEKTPMVALACAHPAKFPEAVTRAIGRSAPLPPELGDLFERQERFTVLPNDAAAVQRFMSERLDLAPRRAGAA
jgi:threonine synthase